MSSRRLWGRPNMGGGETNPKRRVEQRCFTHPPTTMWKLVDSWDLWRTFQICPIGCPSAQCCSQTPPLSPPPYRARPSSSTALSTTTNMGENIMVATEVVPVLYQVIFHQDNPEFSPAIPTDNTGRTAPLADAGNAPMAQVPTKIATTKIAIPTSIRSVKSNTNRT